ncbi:peptide-methionine (S)-S-oxide reductase MsrA [Salipiger abyssi]|uniref:Peptide methionine sulfoxide reductase MsrA n=1 Tax=Salipiger abyssi TaxID=1250539 RepID=A0A1P8UT79_9RHOB|nr:peptide-methionine (S)-S-oxide reductase MsrA [Salipiger abyssi]APZ52613.1 peptide-methionine (S)-S-oxide reductase [Salipiger abyssi]
MIRSVFLSVLILIGLAVQAHRAEAGERRDIVVAGGCFWCVEADFEKVPGVISAVSGYTGGALKNPSYKQVSRGGTGHYEAVKITYDSARVNRDQLYAMFFRSVDPTDAGGQFCDRGESYRTAIFVSDPAEKAAADKAKAEAEAALGQRIVTPILKAGAFWNAEDDHQDYYKGDNIVLTRFGPIKQAKAYKRYRDACGRDQRVRQLWGGAAPFAGG